MATGEEIRKYVTDSYPPTTLERIPLLLLACAETIERLTNELDKAKIQIAKIINCDYSINN